MSIRTASPLLVISPWSGGGVVHRFANTTGVLKTIEEMLRLGIFARSMRSTNEAFNRVLWAVEKGAIPYPGARQADALTLGLGADSAEGRVIAAAALPPGRPRG